MSTKMLKGTDIRCDSKKQFQELAKAKVKYCFLLLQKYLTNETEKSRHSVISIARIPAFYSKESHMMSHSTVDSTNNDSCFLKGQQSSCKLVLRHYCHRDIKPCHCLKRNCFTF